MHNFEKLFSQNRTNSLPRRDLAGQSKRDFSLTRIGSVGNNPLANWTDSLPRRDFYNLPANNTNSLPRDRFYKTPFRPITFRINFQIVDKFPLQKQR
jgi:hypothetical protein